MLALLFFLLCAVCGSVILAAATTSSGRIAGLGKNRQNYQSVEAAARLLENELQNAVVALQEKERITITVEHVEKDNDGDGEDAEKAEETYTTTTYEFSGPDFLNGDVDTGKSGAGSDASRTDSMETANDAESIDAAEENVAAAFSSDNGRNSSLSMLEQMLTDADLSSYIKKGEAYQSAGSIAISDKDEDTSEDAAENLEACEKAWTEAFLTGDNKESVKRHFTMQLSDGAEGGNVEKNSLVEAELQLYGDGTLEIRLSSGETTGDADSESTDKSSADADKYYMLLRGTAELKTQSRSERTDQKHGNDSDDSDDESSETLITKKTTLTWGDFLITKNAVEAGKEKETVSLPKSSREEESSEEMTDNE